LGSGGGDPAKRTTGGTQTRERTEKTSKNAKRRPRFGEAQLFETVMGWENGSKNKNAQKK